MAAHAHECTQDAVIGAMRNEQENLGRRLDGHAKTLYGNGRPGVVDEVRDLKLWRDEQMKKEERAHRDASQIKIGLLLLILTTLAGLIFKH